MPATHFSANKSKNKLVITVRQKEELSAYYMGKRFFSFSPLHHTEIISISPPEHRQTGQGAKTWLEASP